jgi:hypothetical protein
MRILLCSLFLSVGLNAQQTPMPKVEPPKMEASKIEAPRATLNALEAGSLDAFMTSLYAFISGPVGQKRDVAKIRALFHPSCRFVVSGNDAEKKPRFLVLDVEAFLARAVPNWEQGFFEKETKRTTLQWGHMANVWTSYETRKTADGPVWMRGINNVQLQFDGNRWWVMALQFQAEDPNNKLP